MKKKLQLTSLLGLSLLVMTACATSEVSADSADFWSKLVYFFAEIIRFLSFDVSIGLGIILFTVLIRTILLPVFQTQMVASRKMQEAQPLIKELRERYPGRDMESRTKLDQETRKLFKELGIKQSASFWPLLIQMPILLALFQALSNVDFLKTGHFLWFNEKNGAMTGMMYGMPVIIFFFAISAPSGVALYWAVSNAYQVLQTYLLNNPFKIIAEREADVQAKKDLEVKKRKALKKAQKKKK